MDATAGRRHLDADAELGARRHGAMVVRILHIGTDSFGGYGGIALFNRELVTALAAHPACEEVVVLPRLVPRPPEPLPPNTTFVAEAARGRLAYVNAVRRVVREKPFDLVICGHVNLLPIARLAGQPPLLITHGIEAWKRLRDPISNHLVRKVRAVISVSDLTRGRFLAWSQFDGPAYVLPNAVRVENYGIRAKRQDLIERWSLAGKRVLLTLGRIVGTERYKGFDEVLETMPDLLRRDPDIVYIIAGAGSDVARLQQKAAGLGMGTSVRFTGFVSEDEKPDLYNLADVYVMPSRGEGFGFVFLEAMACGVPVIASCLDGGREAVRDGALGQIVDPTSTAEIRAAVEDVLAAHAPKTIPAGLDFFSYSNFEQRTHAIIDALIANA
jgi:glycosyltransferase involved in cell wall biosynthesis